MWLKRIQFLFAGMSILIIILVGGVISIQGAKPQLLSGFFDNARKNVAVAGREIVNIPTNLEKEIVQSVYSNEENFQSFGELKKLAALEKGEILRGFVAMPETLSSKSIYLPIYEGVSPHVLAIGAGVGRENRKMGKGNFPVFAHNMGNGGTFNPTYFSTLQTMNDSVIGEPIYLSDGNKIYTYTIDSLDSYVDRSKTEIMNEKAGENKLLLVACQEDANWWATFYQTGNTYAPYRIVVTASLTDSILFRDAPQNLKDFFPDIVSQRVVVNQVVNSLNSESDILEEGDSNKANLFPDNKKSQKIDQIILTGEKKYKTLLLFLGSILLIGNVLLVSLKKRKEEM